MSAFNQIPKEQDSPASAVVAVTPHDSNNFAGGVARGLLVGTAGAADIVDASGTLRSGVPLQQGYNPIGCLRVNSTNLTASNIWALY